MRTRSGERFSKTVRITADEVTRFAHASGDDNPIHHDAGYARTTRIGRVIASGAHTSSLLMAHTAAHFSRSGPMLGLDFSFRFKRPVFVDQEVRMDWLVVGVRSSTRLRGDVVDLRGRMVSECGTTVVGARGRVLLKDSL